MNQVVGSNHIPVIDSKSEKQYQDNRSGTLVIEEKNRTQQCASQPAVEAKQELLHVKICSVDAQGAIKCVKTPSVKKDAGVKTDYVKKAEQTPCSPDMLIVNLEIVPVVEAGDK